MIEAGMVALINAGIASAYPGLTGGFAAELPENFISASNPWSWSYRSIMSKPLYTLQGQDSLTEWEVQIDCHGAKMVNAIGVARAIDGVLRGGFSGTLSDSDSTVVLGVFRLPSQVDGFNDDARTFVRSLEYNIQYIQI
jgi:hypothetical protein